MIKKFACKNIKAIREYSEIEIRPITVLMGENSSGKSSMLQALSLLAVNTIFGNSIERIKYNNPFSHFGTNDSFKNRGEEVLLGFELEDNQGVYYDILLTYEDEKENHEYGVLKEIKINDTVVKIDFKNPMIKLLLDDLSAIRHIGMLKEDIPSIYDYPNDYVGYFGEAYRDVAKGLSSKSYIHKRMKSIFDYKVKKIDKATGEFYLLDSKIDKSLNLHMFGTSVGTTIPLLTQYAMNNEVAIRDKYRLTIIEEPEINDHPLTQAKFIEALFPKNRPQKHFNIIETHSDHIINKLRAMVAKKVIKPKDIVIYYIHRDSTNNIDKNQFYKIAIDKCGQFHSKDFGKGGFPKGFFDATLDDLFSLGSGC